MKKLNTKKAIKSIDELLKLGEEISNAASDLLRLKESFEVLDDYVNSGNKVEIGFINSFNPVVDDIAFLNVSSFNHSVATGSTAIFTTNSSDYLFSHENINQSTLDIIERLQKTVMPSNKEVEIAKKLKLIDANLESLFLTSNHTFSQWKSNLKSDSDLAKDLRLVIEGLKGHLKILAGQEKKKDLSWNKIYEKIGIQKESYKTAFLKQRTIYEKLHKKLTEIMKKIITLDKNSIEKIYEYVNEHTYSVLHLIDKRHFK